MRIAVADLATTKASQDEAERRHRRHFVERGPEDRTWLVEHYQGLARSLAIKSAGPRDDLDDLVQVAYVGLIRALDRFDPGRGFAFSTFAWATITGELKRHHRDRTWDVRVPRAVQESYLRAAAATEELTPRLQRPPTISELAAHCGDDEALIIQALEARHARTAGSLDAPRNGDAGEPVQVAVVDAATETIDDRDLLRSLMERLPERDRAVVQRRFYDRWSQADIAAEAGCSQMHVSRLLSRALERLREMADVELTGTARGGRTGASSAR